MYTPFLIGFDWRYGPYAHFGHWKPRKWSSAEQNNFKKLISDLEKIPKQAEAKRNGAINPQKYKFNQF